MYAPSSVFILKIFARKGCTKFNCYYLILTYLTFLKIMDHTGRNKIIHAIYTVKELMKNDVPEAGDLPAPNIEVKD